MGKALSLSKTLQQSDMKPWNWIGAHQNHNDFVGMARQVRDKESREDLKNILSNLLGVVV